MDSNVIVNNFKCFFAKKQRSIQTERAFGVIKEDMKFTRFTRRGLAT